MYFIYTTISDVVLVDDFATHRVVCQSTCHSSHRKTPAKRLMNIEFFLSQSRSFEELRLTPMVQDI